MNVDRYNVTGFHRHTSITFKRGEGGEGRELSDVLRLGVADNVQEGDAFEVPVERARGPEDCSISFHEALGAPGLLHIIHNAGDDMVKTLKFIDAGVDMLVTVCKFLSHPHTRSKIVAVCYYGPLSLLVKRPIERFNVHVYKARWGSVAFAVVAVLNIRNNICRYWSLDAYCRGSSLKVEAEIEDLVHKFDEAICSPLFWAMLLTLDKSCSVIRSCFQWAESCPCHGHLDSSAVESHIVKAWSECPLRGMRLPELANGDLFGLIHRWCDAEIADLV